MRKVPSRTVPKDESPSTYAERLFFAVWLAEAEIGVSGPTAISKAIGKSENTISKWAKEQPSFKQSEILAAAVGLDPDWLHRGDASGAVPPEQFGKWLASRRAAERGLSVPVMRNLSVVQSSEVARRKKPS
jgi:hypothetical protein